MTKKSALWSAFYLPFPPLCLSPFTVSAASVSSRSSPPLPNGINILRRIPAFHCRSGHPRRPSACPRSFDRTPVPEPSARQRSRPKGAREEERRERTRSRSRD
jgi:hypothetical protein